MVSSIMESSQTKTCGVCDCAFWRNNRRSVFGDACQNCFKIFERRISGSILVIRECQYKCEIIDTNRSTCILCFLRKCFHLGLTRNGITSIDQLVTYKLPADNKCPVCAEDFGERKSVQFEVISCRQCYTKFSVFYKKLQSEKGLSVVKCRTRKCVVRPETRVTCSFCWLKKCFKVGFTATGFTNMRCISNAASDANQNVKVIDDTLCLAMSAHDDHEDSVLALPAADQSFDSHSETVNNEEFASADESVISDERIDDTKKLPCRQQRRSKLFANFKLTTDFEEEYEDITESRKTMEQIEIDFRQKRLAAAAVIAERSKLLKVIP